MQELEKPFSEAAIVGLIEPAYRRAGTFRTSGGLEQRQT
jgi:hypothetical protein